MQEPKEPRNWQEVVRSKLLSLGSEGCIQMGKLFEEVRTLIPLHIAMRNTINKAGYDETINGDTAQWLYFCTGLRAIGCEFSSGPHKVRKYTDLVRLSKLSTRCSQCGGPLVKAPNLQNKAECLSCHSITSLGVIRKPRKPKPPAQSPAQPIEQPPVQLTEQPKAEEIKVIPIKPKRVIDPYSVPNTTYTLVNTHDIKTKQEIRETARWIKSYIPMASSVSINQIERQIIESHCDVIGVMRKYGITQHQQLVYLISRRNRYEQVLLNQPPNQPLKQGEPS